MRRLTVSAMMSLVLAAATGCGGGGGPESGMPTAAELQDAPTGPPPGAGAVRPKGAMAKNGGRTLGPPRPQSRL